MELEQLPEIQKIIHIGKANGEITYDEINDILPEKLTNSDKIDDVFILLNQYGIEIVEEYEKKQVGRRGDTSSAVVPGNFGSLGEQKVPKALVAELKSQGYEIKQPENKAALTIQDLAMQMLTRGYDLDSLQLLLQKPEFRPAAAKKKKSTGTAGASAADDPIRLYLKEIGKISLISGDKEVELARRIEGGENIIEDAVLRSSLLRSAFIKAYNRVDKGTLRITDIARASKTYYISTNEQKELREKFLREIKPVTDFDKQISSLKAKLKRYTHKSKKHQEVWAQILKLEGLAAEHVIRVGVSQKELQKHVNKIKSMVFRIKEIKRHFLKLKERYGHDVKGIKAFNRYIERNEDLHVVERELGWELTHVYGLTETSPFITFCEPLPEHAGLPEQARAELKARQGVELVSSGELRVVDEAGAEVPRDGQTLGEITVRGNVVMKGYYNDRAATDAAIRDGWFHSGDAAVVHPDGYAEIRDRFKDVIISGGENISSVEVEGCLLRHPAVQEAAVVGMKHEKWGESPHAFVILRAGAMASEDELKKHVRDNLAHFKTPQWISFVEELPKTATGKVQKFVLRSGKAAIARQ